MREPFRNRNCIKWPHGSHIPHLWYARTSKLSTMLLKTDFGEYGRKCWNQYNGQKIRRLSSSFNGLTSKLSTDPFGRPCDTTHSDLPVAGSYQYLWRWANLGLRPPARHFRSLSTSFGIPNKTLEKLMTMHLSVFSVLFYKLSVLCRLHAFHWNFNVQQFHDDVWTSESPHYLAIAPEKNKMR